MKEQEDGVVVGVGCPLAEQLVPLISTEKVHAVAKSTLSKVQIPRCRKGQSSTTLSEVDAVQSPTLSKKKKSNFGGNRTRSGVRVRGLGLVWTSALTRSDQDQHQTRSRTRHRNPTRLVSHVLFTSLLPCQVVGLGALQTIVRCPLTSPDRHNKLGHAECACGRLGVSLWRTFRYRLHVCKFHTGILVCTVNSALNVLCLF